MSTPTNHWKLGLFVVTAVLLGLVAVAYFGSRSMPKNTQTYVSFFDEAVTGLEVGSPVKYRGVSVGNVSRIDVAPDRRHVEVGYDLASDAAKRLHLDQANHEKAALGNQLRAQLGSQGVTGVKYIALDLFEDAQLPEQLSFTPPQHYIPTQPSTMKNLESAANDAAHRLPEVTEQLVALLGRINSVLAAVEEQELPQHAVHTLERVDQLMGLLLTKADQFKSTELSQDARLTLGQLQESANRFNRLLERVDGNSGLLANAERASLSMGDVARNASHVGSEAERTLREVSQAASAVRELADALERQPDMLLKGRARSQP